MRPSQWYHSMREYFNDVRRKIAKAVDSFPEKNVLHQLGRIVVFDLVLMIDIDRLDYTCYVMSLTFAQVTSYRSIENVSLEQCVNIDRG